MPVIGLQIGESPGQSLLPAQAGWHLKSSGKQACPAPQFADTLHSSHRPSTQNGEPAPHIESAEHSMQPNVSLHPAAHFCPPNVQVLSLLDELFASVPEPQAPANVPAAMTAIAAASQCFKME
jgi:hypothetical protein